MRKLALAAVVIVSALFTGMPAPASEGWHRWEGVASGTAGSTVLDRGEWIATASIFDDPGADADGLEEPDYFAELLTGPTLPHEERDDVYRALTWGGFGAERSAHDGDFELPTDRERWPDFTADIAEVRLAADADHLYARIRFASMPRRDAQIATLTFATVGRQPPAAAWPRNAGVIGRWQLAMTVWGSGGEVADRHTTSDLTLVGGAVRTGDHVVEIRVPLRVLPDGPWLVNVGAGLADPQDPSRYWTVPPGQPREDRPGAGAVSTSGANVWDLAFARDRLWDWQEQDPAEALASGDVTTAARTVDPGKLQAGVSETTEQRTGHLTRWYASRYEAGDGIRRGTGPPGIPPHLAEVVPPRLRLRDPGVDYHYTGRLQRYDLYVPQASATDRGDRPLIVYLHGLNNHVNEAVGNLVGLVDELEARGYLFASLLGRGDHFYRGPGELDVLEALADIRRHYRVDPDGIYLLGHSMGAYGVDNVSTRHPDLFAAVAAAQGTASQDLLANLRHVPWFAITSVEDLDPGGAQATHAYETLSALGYDATLATYTRKTHEYSSLYDTLPQVLDLFDASRRDRDPATVTYVRPNDDQPELGLVHDGAYWLDRLQLVDGSASGRAEVTSFGIAHRPLTPAAAHRSRSAQPGDGPSGRTEHVLAVTDPAYGELAEVSNRATVSLENLNSATLDLQRMQLATDGLRLETTTEHAAALRLTGAPGRTFRVMVDGEAHGTVTSEEATLELTVPAGDHAIELRAVTPPEPPTSAGAAPVPSSRPGSRTLPATGGGMVFGVIGVLAAAIAWRRR